MTASTDTTRSRFRPRRFWLAEALVVAGILAFGGFSLISDARLSPDDMLGGLTSIVGR
jgi:hypothetical protein